MSRMRLLTIGGRMRSLAIVVAMCIAAAIIPVHARAQANEAKETPSVVYRCVEANGTVLYTNLKQPRGRCAALFTYRLVGAAPAADSNAVIDRGTYINRDGQTVERPAYTVNGQPPAGASAQCRDGTYSFSMHHRGTCSHHGGVARWLH